MNNLFLTLKAKKIPFSFEHDGSGTVTKITNIKLSTKNNMLFANGRRVSQNLYNELLKQNND